MKTGKKIGLLIGILLLAFGLTIMQIAHHRGEGFTGGLTRLSVRGLSYDQKGYTVCLSGEERFSAKEVEALKIEWLSGSVSVERYDGRDVVVRETASAKLTEDECLRYKLSGGTLSILPCANRVNTLPIKELTVLIPQGLTLRSVDAGTTSASVQILGLEVKGAIGADSVSGSLHAEDCLCAALSFSSTSGSQHILRTDVSGKVDLDSTSGSFSAEGLRCDSLNAGSSSGSHKIAALSCDTVKLSSTSGSQRVTELDCRVVQCDSSSGSVHLSFATAPAGVDVETTSGSVELTFPKGTGIDLDFDRTSGSLHGDIVRGSIPVNVETTSGSLTIRYQ